MCHSVQRPDRGDVERCLALGSFPIMLLIGAIYQNFLRVKVRAAVRYSSVLKRAESIAGTLLLGDQSEFAKVVIPECALGIGRLI